MKSTHSQQRNYDLAIIGAGPAGTAAAITAARAGAEVIMFEKRAFGRDKICGDGLTPRAVAALDQLGISLDQAHPIEGLRMIAGSRVRELDWPSTTQFPTLGAVWPRRSLDAALATAAQEAGVELVWETEALPLQQGTDTVGVLANGKSIKAGLVILAAGAAGASARILGAERIPNEPYGLAIRSYVESPRHDENMIEACLTINDQDGLTIPGYGWMFPTGDGRVNIGVGALSTMKNFKKLNLNNLLQTYRASVTESWGIGPNLERPRAWRLPMTTRRRVGPGWVAVGDAAGLVNPMNGEGIDYGLESGILAARCFLDNPATATECYEVQIADRFDSFLELGRRFSFLIGHPLILRAGLRLSLSSEYIATLTLGVMGNIIDEKNPGAAGWILEVTSKLLAIGDPILRRTRASA